MSKGMSDQTADLQQWQDSSGKSLTVVDKAGRMDVATATSTEQLHVAGNIKASQLIFANGAENVKWTRNHTYLDRASKIHRFPV